MRLLDGAAMNRRHLAVLSLEITPLDRPARIGVSSQLSNRQDSDETNGAGRNPGEDPRRGRAFDRRVLVPQLQRHETDLGDGGEVTLGYRCVRSGMTLACAYRHEVESDHPVMGRIREPRPPARFSKTESAIQGPAPTLGEQTDAVLAEMGRNAEEIEKLRADGVVEVNPLLPENTWDYFCLDNVLYHGKILTMIWDKTGEKYGKGKGLTVLADGKQIAHSETLSRVRGDLDSVAD